MKIKMEVTVGVTIMRLSGELTMGEGDLQLRQAVIEQLQREAVQRGLSAMLITFEPLPREYFQLETSPPRLTRLRTQIMQTTSNASRQLKNSHAARCCVKIELKMLIYYV